MLVFETWVLTKSATTISTDEVDNDVDDGGTGDGGRRRSGLHHLLCEGAIMRCSHVASSGFFYYLW